MEFFDWAALATHSGSLVVVLAITQITKNIPVIKKIPTQLWSYLVSLLVLYTAYYFNNQLDWSKAALILFNGVIVALSANGGFSALQKVFHGSYEKNSTNTDKSGNGDA